MSMFFATLVIMLLHNNFNSLIKLFSDLYIAKFLDTSTKVISVSFVKHLYFYILM